VGNDNDHNAAIAKYSKIIDVYKEQNKNLRSRLEAAET